MRIVTRLLPLILAASLTSLAQAACDYPAAVQIPDGKSATSEEIAAASSSVKKYMADMDAYMACMDAEEAALPVEQQTPEVKSLHAKRHNAAVDAMEATATQFNTQLRAFKAAGGK